VITEHPIRFSSNTFYILSVFGVRAKTDYDLLPASMINYPPKMSGGCVNEKEREKNINEENKRNRPTAF